MNTQFCVVLKRERENMFLEPNLHQKVKEGKWLEDWGVGAGL
jgi:hypothetical protein